MTFIEHDFPIEKLNPVALSEGNAKKPVYRMHKWWARRLGSVFRTIIISAFSPPDESADSIWQKFCEGFDVRGKIILDPFMGGGTTLVESLRLGGKVIGVDINPVAWFVCKKEVEPVSLKQLREAFVQLEQTVGERIKSHYQTTCPTCQQTAEVMYYFWVKTADCATCGTKVRLFQHYELSRRDKINVSICPNCLQLVETVGYQPSTTCPECQTIFDPQHGVSKRGAFQCSTCGNKETLLSAIKRKGTALDMELHALEGYCQACGRFFKRVDSDDLNRLARSKQEFEHQRDQLLFPRQAVPTEGRSDPRPVNHGYTYFWQMFNERQLLCLSLLLEEIVQVADQNIRELLLLAFSDSLNTNNMFCKYEVAWHKISLFFSLHAFHPIERPAENNIWGTKLGRGTFAKCFQKVLKGKIYCQKPYERLANARGQRISQFLSHERITATLVSQVEELTQDHAALLRAQSSTDLAFIPDKSVDAVITDPPYFDNVQYAELADFFYVWLRQALQKTYPCFTPEYSGRANEILKNDKAGKTTDFFTHGLCQVFSECQRVLKDDGLLVFTFHHNKVWAWERLAQLLIDAGFYISATPIVRSEGKGEVHSSEGNIRYDCIFVCRKRGQNLTNFENLSGLPYQETILASAQNWARRTRESGLPMSEADVFTVVMGKAIQHYTQQLNGAGMPLADRLAEIAQLSKVENRE